MVRIKLQRIGKKKEPHFRLIVQEKAKDPHNKSIEIIGWLNPRSKEKDIKKDRAEYWLSVGAQPTDSVYNLFVAEGIIKGDKKKTFTVSKKRQSKIDSKKATEEAKNAPAEAPVEEDKTEEKPAEEKAEEPKVETPETEEKQAETVADNV